MAVSKGMTTTLKLIIAAMLFVALGLLLLSISSGSLSNFFKSSEEQRSATSEQTGGLLDSLKDMFNVGASGGSSGSGSGSAVAGSGCPSGTCGDPNYCCSAGNGKCLLRAITMDCMD